MVWWWVCVAGLALCREVVGSESIGFTNVSVEASFLTEPEDHGPDSDPPQVAAWVRFAVSESEASAIVTCKLANHPDMSVEAQKGSLFSPPLSFGSHVVVLELAVAGQVLHKVEVPFEVACCLPKSIYQAHGDENLRRALAAPTEGSGFTFGKDVFQGNIPYWTQVLGQFGYLDPSRPVSYLEVGTWEGQSAVWMGLAALQNPGSRLITIDVMKEFYLTRWDQNAAALQMGERLRFMNGDSFRMLNVLIDEGEIEKFDVAYIDAAHDARSTLANTVLAWKLLKPGGLMFWDDYGLDGDNGPARAVDAFWQIWGEDLVVVKRPTWENWQPMVQKRRHFSAPDVAAMAPPTLE